MSAERSSGELGVENSPPVLYLDVDGVVNFFGGKNSARKRSGLGYIHRRNFHDGETGFSYKITWSGELLHKLSKLPLEVLWLTSWGHKALELEHLLGWCGSSGFLSYDSSAVLPSQFPEEQQRAKMEGKLKALLKNQETNPRPFIWADDELELVDVSALPGDHLLVIPQEETGLTRGHLFAMEKFLSSLGKFEQAFENGGEA